MPPASDAPPITAAATACSSSPSPIDGSGAPSRSTWMMPAKPASSEQIMKQAIFTRAVGMPIDCAAGRKPPVARTQLPKLVRDKQQRVTRMAIADEPEERHAEQLARADDRR